MRSVPAILAAMLALALGATPALAQGGGGSLGTTQKANSAAVRSLDGTLNLGMRQAGSYSGAYVLDLNTGQTLYSRNANTGRLPASVEKLYTTTTALTRFGPNATLTTSILGNGTMDGDTFVGTLYLRGGGDPTFGSAAFDHAAYGTGASIQQLVANLVRATGIRSLQGNVVADESYFDSVRGTPATGNQPNTEVEGELSALAFNAGWTSANEVGLVARPALTAGQQLVAALKAAGVKVPKSTAITTGRTPAGAATLASVHSPSIATLIALTNAPSDNFFAEMLLKDIGARFGGGGTTADGAAVVRAQVAQSFGIHPRLDDGSGLSRYDRTTPVQVVTLLKDEAVDTQFTNSLAVAGETGTLQDEMQGTYAQGRCRGKTGTLHDASNLVGYCTSRDGHTLAFAFLMNGIYPDYAHPIQDRMAVAVAKYGG
jgi:serine-type D-Ala-D-Ala carboxypeptidase/endopeptidase (penicillin-binding protein 4)